MEFYFISFLLFCYHNQLLSFLKPVSCGLFSCFLLLLMMISNMSRPVARDKFNSDCLSGLRRHFNMTSRHSDWLRGPALHFYITSSLVQSEGTWPAKALLRPAFGTGSHWGCLSAAVSCRRKEQPFCICPQVSGPQDGLYKSIWPTRQCTLQNVFFQRSGSYLCL